MGTDVRFSKIRYSESDQNVELEWDETKGTDVVHSALKSPAAPEPEFVVTLKAFKPELLNILELKSAYGANLEVHQISISYRNDRRGIVISAKKKIGGANSPFVLHSPYLPEPSEEVISSKGMSSTMIELLNNLEKLAELYRDGHRAQQELALNRSQANGTQPHQADIEDADVDKANGSENDVENQEVVLPRLGSKLKFSGEKRRTYRVIKVSSERVIVESGDRPAQAARVDQLTWDEQQKAWMTDYLYDPNSDDANGALVPAEATEEMPV